MTLTLDIGVTRSTPDTIGHGKTARVLLVEGRASRVSPADTAGHAWKHVLPVEGKAGRVAPVDTTGHGRAGRVLPVEGKAGRVAPADVER